MKKILLMLTGGTICSFSNNKGVKDSDQKRALPILIDNLKNNNPKHLNIEFDVVTPMDILSENMVVSDWNKILSAISNVNFKEYRGIIITHGTDTLAYTAAMLGIMLAGSGLIPTILVSSQYPLSDDRANGNDNFACAVNLIEWGIAPNVYAVYKNSDNNMYLHKGANLLQCANYSDNFFSKEMVLAEDWRSIKNKKYTGVMMAKKGTLKENAVLVIKPYPGIDYSAFNLEGKKVVLHYLYHSSTAAVDCGNKINSVLYLLDECVKRGILFVVAPFQKELLGENRQAVYSSTNKLLEKGAVELAAVTKEMAYAKTVIAVSFFEGENIKRFLQEEINDEFIY